MQKKNKTIRKARRQGQEIRKIPLLVICGPTATGKSALAVELARRFEGEVISADSRQVYRGLNIGTGKITQHEMRGVPHHLLDVADPHSRFTVEDFKRQAQAKIAEIASRGHLPILCGGTGFYIQAVVDDVTFPDVPPDPKLRARLEKIAAEKSVTKNGVNTKTKNSGVEKLFAMLKKLDPKRAAGIDRHNPRRLIRAIEIARALRPELLHTVSSTGLSSSTYSDPSIVNQKVNYCYGRKRQTYDPLFIGIDLPAAELKKKIRTRLLARLKQGMVAEARRLHTSRPNGAGLSWKRMDELGLEYRYLALYLQNRGSSRKRKKPSGEKKPPCETLAALVEKLSTEIWRYARRQKTWFKRDARITWFAPTDKKQIAAFVAKNLAG